MNYFLYSWIFFSMIGFSSESVFTGVKKILGSVKSKKPVDWHLSCETWLWTPVVYGLSAAVGFHPAVQSWAGVADLTWPLRGLIYTAGIFGIEFFWGWLLDQTIGFCPWDYGKTKWSVKGYIRLDYWPSWFAFGMILEQAGLIFARIFPCL
ncbi:MAG: hypothetical protein HYT79_11130 [Elusimicrobia bacterium]|nr:hypothetical protein [Elusimicrobiota bacterium]